METFVSKVVASVTLLATGDTENRSIQSGWGPNVFVKGHFYPGLIMECDTAILPGETGDIVLSVVHTSKFNLSLKVGDSFELRSGPDKIIATGVVRTVLQSE